MKIFKFLLALVFMGVLAVEVNAAAVKVENLTTETTTAAGDEIWLTDVGSSNDTNKITITNFFGAVPVAITSSAVITGLTVEATGDTASGDNSAMGYTASEGLILTGQGSTNDVTIKNDADADVAVVPTGTTNFDIVGDATAATFAPDGDTSAGDSAASGYTAAEGLILTGQGSTNDVTIKNDADADVAVVPTGTTNFDIVGVATAETFEPDGDTSTGDNSAIGYTSTEGCIITGQGSTNDVTIKNDADAEVAGVPTGTRNLSMPAGTLILADGGTVTQATNKTTGVTLNTYSGQITMDNASLAAGVEATFTVTNSVVTALDVVCVSIADSPDADSVIDAFVTDVGSGTFDITISNVSGNADTGAIVINFIVLRGASS